ncbi:MAG TPA: hypothetical protein VGM53_23440 [Streptosporangiaceae bacterium]|jgi:hypothetical protein
MRRFWIITPTVVLAVAALATGGASAAAASSPAKASITVKPSAIYAPTSLCPGSSHPTSTVITGTGFPASAAYTVTYNGKTATRVTGTTSASGGFTATLTNVAQPDGYYQVKARAGTVSAATWVSTNGYTCVTGQGTLNALHWKWQGAGFDASTAAVMLISGSVYHSTTTSANGAFYVKFTAPCPAKGKLPMSFQVYAQGKKQTISAGSLDCT